MQPRNAHEVVYSSAGKNLPLIMRNGALIPHGERNQNTGIGRLRQRAHELFPDHLAHTLDAIAGLVDTFFQKPVLFSLTHVTRCPAVPRKGPLIEMESMRMGTAVRTLEPYEEAPARAGAQLWQRGLVRFRILAPRLGPGKRSACRNIGVLRQHALHVENEPHIAV